MFPTGLESSDQIESRDASGNVLECDSDARVLVQELVDSSSVLIFGHRPGSGRRPRGKPSVPGQTSLFG